MDCSPPGSSVQARILKWAAVPSSRGSSWPRNRTYISCTEGRFFTAELPGKPLLLLEASVCGILQERILEWVAISFSRGSSQPRDRTQVSQLQPNTLTSAPPGKPYYFLGQLIYFSYTECNNLLQCKINFFSFVVIVQSISCVQPCDPLRRQHAGLLHPSPAPGACSDSCPLIQWAIWPSHPLLSPSPSVFNLSQHQGLFQWVGSSHKVAKVLELQHLSLQWIFRVDFL